MNVGGYVPLPPPLPTGSTPLPYPTEHPQHTTQHPTPFTPTVFPPPHFRPKKIFSKQRISSRSKQTWQKGSHAMNFHTHTHHTDINTGNLHPPPIFSHSHLKQPLFFTPEDVCSNHTTLPPPSASLAAALRRVYTLLAKSASAIGVEIDPGKEPEGARGSWIHDTSPPPPRLPPSPGPLDRQGAPECAGLAMLIRYDSRMIAPKEVRSSNLYKKKGTRKGGRV